MNEPLILEQHIHGAFGINFNTCNVDEILTVANELYKRRIGAFFPTLVTDSISNINRQISIIKEAAKKCPRILGIHLEGIFINPEKKGIHNPEHFMSLTVDNYKLIEDDFIKIVPRKFVEVEDENKKMNLSISQINGEMLVISNFTLYANTSHGFRPDFFNSMMPQRAEEMYLKFIELCKTIEKGEDYRALYESGPCKAVK